MCLDNNQDIFNTNNDLNVVTLFQADISLNMEVMTHMGMFQLIKNYEVSNMKSEWGRDEMRVGSVIKILRQNIVLTHNSYCHLFPTCWEVFYYILVQTFEKDQSNTRTFQTYIYVCRWRIKFRKIDGPWTKLQCWRLARGRWQSSSLAPSGSQHRVTVLDATLMGSRMLNG